jgi:hypothetical protein
MSKRRGRHPVAAACIRAGAWLVAVGEWVQGQTEMQRLGLAHDTPAEQWQSRDGALHILPPPFNANRQGPPTMAVRFAEYPQQVTVHLSVDDALGIGKALMRWAGQEERQRALAPVPYLQKVTT